MYRLLLLLLLIHRNQRPRNGHTYTACARVPTNNATVGRVNRSKSGTSGCTVDAQSGETIRLKLLHTSDNDAAALIRLP